MQSQLEYEDAQAGYGQAVAHASAEARAAFITRTYLHLFGAVIAFAGLEVALFLTPFPGMMLSALASGRGAMLLFVAAFVGVSWLANNWALNATSRGTQYAGLGLYVALEAVLFVPLIAYAIVASQGADGGPPAPNLLPKAALITLTLFGGLTGVVFITRRDFSFMRGVLMFAGFAAMGLVGASLIFGFTLGMGFSYAMVALACGYILFHTSNVMQHYRTDQYVAASLALFASVMLLFYYVLRIFLARRR